MSSRKNAKEAPKKSDQLKMISIKRLNLRITQFTIYGVSELIVHNWSKKAKEEMLGKQQGVKPVPRELRNPQEEYESSLYRLSDGGYGFRAVGFKKAAVRVCKLNGIPMTDARQLFYVRADEGDLVRINGVPRMREDMVRVPPGTGNADLRYRAGFPKWSVRLTVVYNANLITEEQVLSIFEDAGFSVGVGEWRNERDGMYGAWTLFKKEDE